MIPAVLGSFTTSGSEQRCQRCVGSNGRTSTSARCYFRSAAVKGIGLLTLLAAGISVSARLAAAVLCCSVG